VKSDGATLRAMADQADDDPWRRRFRKAVGKGDRVALEALAEEAAARRQSPTHLALVARALEEAGNCAAAERLLRWAQTEYPTDFWVNIELAHSLCLKQPPDWLEAIRFYQAALALRPLSPGVLTNFGVALYKRGKTAEAVAAYRKAIDLEPNLRQAHMNLGVALMAQRKPAEALAAFRKAIELKPEFAEAHYNLGYALQNQGNDAQAIAAYEKAIELKRDYAEAHDQLGNAHYNLGNALGGRGKLAEAAAAYRKAIEHRPDLAEAHCNLGLVLLSQEQFAEALTFLRHGQALGGRNPKWRYPSAEWVQLAERLLRLKSKLPALLSGIDQPADTADRMALAIFCGRARKCSAAARFYADAFAEQPALATNLGAGHRYNAACAAALAGCGQGNGADQSYDKERARLRRQALDWLRADLACYAEMVNAGPAPARSAARQRLQDWQQDGDFAGVRGSGMAGLPAEEREAWRRLWADVAAMLDKAAEKTNDHREQRR
jgi:tetratricopeptide (TPR) repeat protein